MARIVRLVSDITGAEAPEAEFISLVVRSHPAILSSRSLDVLPSEVEALKSTDNIVTCEIKNGSSSREVSMTLAEFRKIVSDDVVKKAAGTRGRKLGTTNKKDTPAA